MVDGKATSRSVVLVPAQKRLPGLEGTGRFWMAEGPLCGEKEGRE